MALRADDRSYFAILKKEIHTLAVEAGFNERRVGEVDIIVAELTSNLVKHANGGTIWVKLVEEDGVQGIEIISVDNGPGMQDVAHMMRDGFSTKKNARSRPGSDEKTGGCIPGFFTERMGNRASYKGFCRRTCAIQKAGNSRNQVSGAGKTK